MVSTPVAEVMKFFRAEKGLNQEQAAKAVHISNSLIAKFEVGTRIPTPDTAKRMDALFGSRTLIQKLSLTARLAREPVWFRPFGEYEREAVALRAYQPLYVPGLLQTEAYARCVLNTGVLDPEKAEDLLAARMERQATVRDGERPPMMTFVVDEAALLRGDRELMREQAARLLELARRPTISLHVVPLAAGIYVGQVGPFTIATMENGEEIGFVEDQLTGRVVNDPREIAALHRVWEAVRSVALPRDQTEQLLRRMVNADD